MLDSDKELQLPMALTCPGCTNHEADKIYPVDFYEASQALALALEANDTRQAIVFFYHSSITDGEANEIAVA